MTTFPVARAERLFSVEQTITTSDDYYTPKHVFDVLNIRFDLDVASPPGGVSWIPADRYYTQTDDGLASDWSGRVWMNPPYSRPETWTKRFMEHADGIALLPFSKSKWFIRLWEHADGITVPSAGFWRDWCGKGTEIFLPVFFAAYGPESVEAISRIGKVRTL